MHHRHIALGHWHSPLVHQQAVPVSAKTALAPGSPAELETVARAVAHCGCGAGSAAGSATVPATASADQGLLPVPVWLLCLADSGSGSR